jgi:DNA-binding HxlR family transcriptional regulator
MYEYGQYCPVARASELLADRWTPLIVRELLAGIRRFNELGRGLPGISRGLLAERLRRLEQAGIVRRVTEGCHRGEYHLTRAGDELQALIDLLGAWGARWAFGEPRPSELDPVVLLWWMKRRVQQDRLPSRGSSFRSTSAARERAATDSCSSGPTSRSVSSTRVSRLICL